MHEIYFFKRRKFNEQCLYHIICKLIHDEFGEEGLNSSCQTEKLR